MGEGLDHDVGIDNEIFNPHNPCKYCFVGFIRGDPNVMQKNSRDFTKKCGKEPRISRLNRVWEKRNKYSFEEVFTLVVYQIGVTSSVCESDRKMQLC
ncbi:hypothetical protein KHA80_00745 [Anaerobacillus sp. HL2]|nr:hypothetical protein KHA80_00745 [Anaerobacillus sp. HL2]